MRLQQKFYRYAKNSSHGKNKVKAGGETVCFCLERKRNKKLESEKVRKLRKEIKMKNTKAKYHILISSAHLSKL